MNFSLFDNQHGVLVPVAVDGTGVPQPVTGLSAASSNPAMLTVAQDAGINTDFDVQAQGLDGTCTITISGTNASGAVISTPFTFTITAPPAPDVAVGFTATLINVANN